METVTVTACFLTGRGYLGVTTDGYLLYDKR